MWKIVKTNSQLQEITLLEFEDSNDASNWLYLTAKAFQWRFSAHRGELFNGYYVDKDHNSYEVR